MACKWLDEIIKDGGNSRITNGDLVERLKIMNYANLAILLLDTEPSRAIG